MTDSAKPVSDQLAPLPSPSSQIRPEELPPVEPPSAGYIVQLFLIPALIVAAVIGVWALFGKLADSDTDLQQLVAELGSANEHRRWRAALGLAQVLKNEQVAPDENGVPLAEQPAVAGALAGLLKESLDSKSTLDDDIKHQEFLARTLGSLRADAVVLPVLGLALQADRNIEVRKSSLMSLAMIAGRHFATQAALQNSGGKATTTVVDSDAAIALSQPLSNPTLVDLVVIESLRRAAQDEEPSIRHLAAYVLALVSGSDAIETLKVMLLDGDRMVRANAGVGLARNGVAAGVPVLTKLLHEGVDEIGAETSREMLSDEQKKEIQSRQFEQPIILRNCIRAIGSQWTVLSDEQKTTLTPILQQLSESYVAADVRQEAKTVLNRNKAANGN